MITTAVLKRVSDAMDHQQKKFGQEPTATPLEAIAILGEEFGEFCRAINQDKFAEAQHEAFQIVAVTLAWLQGDLHYGKQA
jgi:hypothetical protein